MIAYNICKGENETGKRRKETSWAVWNIAFNLLACDLAVGLRYLLERSHYTEQITETEKERKMERKPWPYTRIFMMFMSFGFETLHATILKLNAGSLFPYICTDLLSSVSPLFSLYASSFHREYWERCSFRFRITFSVLFFIPNLFGCLAQCREMLPVVHLAAFSNEINHSFILHNCRKRVAFT